MALRLGWTPDEERTSYWRGDPSVDWDRTPEDERAAYDLDGDGSHLRLRPGTEPPTEFRFRALTADERAAVNSLATAGALESQTVVNLRDPSLETTALWTTRTAWWAMRIGVRLSEADIFTMHDGLRARFGAAFTAPRVSAERVYGISMLPRWVVNGLSDAYGPEIVTFYGGLVWRASSLEDAEKKTSSHGPTATAQPSAAPSASASAASGGAGTNGAALTSAADSPTTPANPAASGEGSSTGA